MKKKVIVITLIVMVLIIFSSCIRIPFPDPYPKYERELNEQDGVVVMIDGVKYKALPALKWTGQRLGDKFGTAGGNNIYLCEEDPDRNFIFIWDEEFQPVGWNHEVVLYRTDKEIPPPSAKSVDEFYWSEIDFRGDKAIRTSQWLSDKEIIKAIFEELSVNQDTRVSEPDSIVEYSMSVSCTSSQVPGARYDLYFEHVDGKLVCGNYFDGYVEFSLEVLEQIAGHEIDLEELIAGR